MEDRKDNGHMDMDGCTEKSKDTVKQGHMDMDGRSERRQRTQNSELRVDTGYKEETGAQL